jgi:hypothetical protein
VLNAWKSAISPQDARTSRLQAQAAIPNGRTSRGMAKTLDQMTDAEYWAHLDREEQKGK